MGKKLKKNNLQDIRIECSHTKLLPIEQLVGNPRNPNKHPENQIETLAKIIKIQGWRCPITISSRSGFIVRGHGRYQAALKLGLKSVPVDIQNYENESAEWADLIADNRLSELSEIDNSMIFDLISELPDDYKNLTGYTNDDFENLIEKIGTEISENETIEDDDICDDDQKKIKTVRGDIYHLGRHRLMCGDATILSDIEKLIGREKIDCVFSDPPYGITIQNKVGKIGNSKNCREYDQIIGDNSIETARNFHGNCLALGIEKSILWGGNYFTEFLPASKSWIVWDKENGDNYFGDFEMAWTSFDKSPKLYRWAWNGMTREGSKIDELKTRIHPTQKPVVLFCEIFKDFEFQTCLDGFLGSGSTIIACEKSGRTCFGIEMSEKYCDQIVIRYVNFCKKNNLNFSVYLNDREITNDFDGED